MVNANETSKLIMKIEFRNEFNVKSNNLINIIGIKNSFNCLHYNQIRL